MEQSRAIQLSEFYRANNLMSMTYIRFDAPENESQESKDGLIKSLFTKAFIGVLKKVIPIANPDFEDKIENVKHWLVELDSETGIPEREIGIDAANKVIIIMPYKNNYGYWTDNNLLLNDFKVHFNASEISKENFEKHWEIFYKERGLSSTEDE